RPPFARRRAPSDGSTLPLPDALPILQVQLDATPDITVPEEIVVLIVLGNPDDDLFVGPSKGMSANGSVTGYLWINIWPNDEILRSEEHTSELQSRERRVCRLRLRKKT